MPVYEFRCGVCEKRFDVVATLKEKETGLKPVCPHCGSSLVQQVFGRFTVIGGSKGNIDTDFENLKGEDYGDTTLDEDFDSDGLSDENDDIDNLDTDLDLD